MTDKTIQPGSKMDKLVKLFAAMRAVVNLAPWGGGLNTSDPELLVMHDELNKRFLAQAEMCGFSEHDALKMCSAEVNHD